MKIWLVEWQHRAEGAGVVGVYAQKPTMEQAREAMKKFYPTMLENMDKKMGMKTDRSWGELTIEEYEVQSV